ncbi:porin family protein [Winogradskyella ursingii]|uniref:porin family protein n=1 Tax=Winogradskyella ursingii TaxID=2686079 RepID=UPI001FEA04C1|nr:porin family protein [Winogradskyella ursingii]
MFILFFINSLWSLSQGTNKDVSELYNAYREDQFYAGITYNLLNNKPSGVSQNGFSSGFHFGFIRDMPLNERRNKAIGTGIGLSTNSYNQNLLIDQMDRVTTFKVIDESEINVSKNKFTTYVVELPIEFRWRTSTATEYNFWRIYSGFKFGYIVYNSTKFKSDQGDIKLSNLDAFNTLQYGLTLSAGYGTWNFHLYYGLNDIFENDSKLEDKNLDLKSFKIGLMFYIL